MDMQGSSLLAIDVTACLCIQDNIFSSNTIAIVAIAMLHSPHKLECKPKGTTDEPCYNVAKVNRRA